MKKSHRFIYVEPTNFEKSEERIKNNEIYQKFNYIDGGRNALRVISKLFNIKSIALPSYLDDSVIYPFHRENVKVEFYPLDSKLNAIIPTELNTDALLLIHYWGFPQRTIKFKNFKGIVIEDCALSFLSKKDNTYLGLLGDASIFSFRKHLPVPYGGAFIINSGEKIRNELNISLEHSDLIAYYMYIRYKLRNLQWALGGKAGTIIGLLYSHLLPFPVRGHQQEDIYDISKYFINIIEHQNIEEIISIRRRNYVYLLDRIPDYVTPIFNNLPDGVTPHLFPAVVEKEIRDRLIRFLKKNRIQAGVNWDLPIDISKSDFPESHELSRSNIVFPIHQQINKYDLDRLLKLLKEFRRFYYD